MKKSSSRKLLCSGGVAFALCALALTARAQYSNTVLGLNPILYYQLNDTTPVPGNVWTNAGTVGTAGTLMGLNLPYFQVLPGALVAEPANGGAGFDGISMYAPLPYSRTIDPSKGNPQAPFTIEGWYNPGTSSPSGGDGCVINFVNMGGRSGWILYQDASLGWDWRIYANSGGNFAARVSSGVVPNAGTYYHVVLVWDGTNASMYVDGALAAGPTPAPTFVPIGYDSGGNPARIVSIGIRSDFSYEWSGSAQEVAVYTNALSAATILAHYQNGTNAAPLQTYESLVTALNPLLYYRLNDPGYTNATPGSRPVPFQPGQPTAPNLGSLGSPGYDATYGPGTVAAVAGAPYAGFGSNSYSVQFHGLGDSVDGDYGTVQIPALTNVTSASNFTFTCWFYNNSFQASISPLVWQRSSVDNASDAAGLWFFDASQLETMWNDQDYGAAYGNPDPPQGDWSFISAVWTPTNTTIYLNGVAKSITPTNTARDFSVGPIFLGADIYDDQNINGRLAEVAMFTYALSAAEIQSLYNAAQPPPQIESLTQTPAGPTNYEEQTITFNVEAFGDGTLHYQWFTNSVAITGQTGTNLILTGVHVTSSGNYSVSVSNAYGAVTSSVVTLDVVAGPPVITQQPTPAATTRYTDGNVTFSVSAVGTVPITYQWVYDSIPISGATSSSLTLTGLQSSNAGTYGVVLTNPHGTLPSSNEVLTIIGVATNYASAIVSLGPTAYWRLNETSGTTAFDYMGGYNGIISGGVTLGQPGATYPGLDPSNTAYVFDASTEGVVSTPFLINGIEGTFTALCDVTGTVYAPGIMDARGGPGSACGFGTYTDGVTLQYEWDNQGNTYGYAPTVNLTGLQLTPNTWCLVVLSVGRNQTIMYVDNGTGLLSETNDVPSFAVSNTGPLTIGWDDITFGFTPNPYFPGGIDEAAYFSRALTPTEVVALDHALFSNAPVAAPQLIIPPIPQSAFLGSPASFTVSVEGALPLSFQWQFNSANIPGATDQTFVIPSVDYSNAGIYQLKVSNSVSSTTSLPATLTVLDPAVMGNVAYGLVAHYTFDSNCLDSSGYGNNGFGENSPTYVPGKIGSAIQVNDAGASPNLSQYVNLGSYPDTEFNFGSTFSVAWWVNYTTPVGDIPMVATAINSTTQPGWAFADSLCDDGGGNMEISFESGSGDFTAPAAYKIDDGNWHHVVVTADLINDDALVYIDGVKITTYFLNGKGSALTSASIPSSGDVYPGYSIVMGNDPTGFYGGFCGSAGGYTLDDTGIWDRLLTPAEVAGIYAAGNSGNSFDTYGPVQLTIKRTSTGQLQISWQKGTLESAPSLNGPWTPVAGATAPVYVVTPSATLFYRVQ